MPTTIGTRLRAARSARRLTLDALAESAGVTKGYLSKIENDRASASVAVLVRLCEAMSLPMGALFDDVPPGDIVRADAYPPITFGGEGQSEHLLTPPGEQRLQVIHGDIEPGGGSGDESYELPADVGFVLVLAGDLTLSFDDRTVSLGTGDAFTFDPRRRHSFRSGSRATVLWVLTPSFPTRNEMTG
ncbi:MAG: XRE family transcriptional regulator [Rhodococcus sp. (in: high G+C Gram-positive bacteria)]